MTTISENAVDILYDLVACDTTSRNSNLIMIQEIESLLKKLGISSTRVANADGSKANLFATIGPMVEGGIVLSGHTDVVPVDSQLWDTDPFAIAESGGRLYGRGTSDMKSFLAVALAVAPYAQSRPLKRPLHFAFSYDEEVGCLGAPAMVRQMSAELPKPAFAIIGEPTDMQVVIAHKGVLSFETTVTGVEAHSSQTDKGLNAVHYASELVVFLRHLSLELARSGKHDARFSPAHSTVHVGIIEGGTARNIIPKRCRFCWEIRPLPGEDTAVLLKRFEEAAHALEGEMQQAFPESSIKTVPISRMPAMESTASNDMQHQVMTCAQTNGLHSVAYGTEAGIFQEHGIPAIVCGPGSIQQAHKPNEFIELSQIEKCAEFLQRIIVSLE